jgi:hypothetical protein
MLQQQRWQRMNQDDQHTLIVEVNSNVRPQQMFHQEVNNLLLMADNLLYEAPQCGCGC